MPDKGRLVTFERTLLSEKRATSYGGRFPEDRIQGRRGKSYFTSFTKSRASPSASGRRRPAGQLHFLQQLLDAIPVPVFYKDRQGVFRGCNVAYEKFVGLTKEQVVGRTVFEVAPQDLANIYYQADETLFTRPGVQVYETSFLHADGNRREIIFNKATYVGADGCVAGLVGVILDITERKQIEKALRKSEERFRELYDHAPVSYHEFDLEGHITRVNRTELEMLGYAHEEMIGQPIWKFNVEEESARKRILGKLAGDISPSKGYELTYRRKDGATIWLLAEDRLILDSEGRITGMRGIFQDITERKLAEEALRRSEKEATRLARENAIMAEIGRIINSTLNIEEVYRFLPRRSKSLSLLIGLQSALLMQKKTSTQTCTWRGFLSREGSPATSSH